VPTALPMRPPSFGPPGVDSSNRSPVATSRAANSAEAGSCSPRPLRSWPWAIQCRSGNYRSGSSGRAYTTCPQIGAAHRVGARNLRVGRPVSRGVISPAHHGRARSRRYGPHCGGLPSGPDRARNGRSAHGPGSGLSPELPRRSSRFKARQPMRPVWIVTRVTPQTKLAATANRLDDACPQGVPKVPGTRYGFSGLAYGLRPLLGHLPSCVGDQHGDEHCRRL